MAVLSLHEINEATGTSATSIADQSGGGNALTAITYSTGSIVAGISGQALKCQAGTVASCTVNSALTALAGSNTCSIIFLGDFFTNYKTSTNGGGVGVITTGPADDLADLQFDATGFNANFRTSAGTYFNPVGTWPTASWVGQQHAIIATLNTTLGSQRAKLWLDAFVYVTDDGAAQNTTLGFNATGAKTLYVGAFPGVGGSQLVDTAVGHLSIDSAALTGAQVMSRTLRLFANNDADPTAAGAQLLAASTNGGTDDVSGSTSDHVLSFTITIGATNNRKVIILVSYFGVSTGVTAITFNGSSTGVNRTAQQQATSGSLMGCDLYEILDADLPGAGTYTIAVTVDGTLGVACGSPTYHEVVAQSYATNIGVATSTGTSATATLSSSASAGSIIVGQLLDVSFGDAPVGGVNQLSLAGAGAGQATSSAIRQNTAAKYVTSSGSNSLSWTSLTTATQKVAVAIELLAASQTDNPPVRRPPQPQREAWQGESPQRTTRIAPPSGSALADNPPTRRGAQPPIETWQAELPQRLLRIAPPGGAAAADNPPIRRAQVRIEIAREDERPRLRLQPLLPPPDDPFLGLWADRGEQVLSLEIPVRARVPLPSGATADSPPVGTRRVLSIGESIGVELPVRARTLAPSFVDPPPLERPVRAPEQATEEPVRRLRVTPDAVDLPPLDLRRVPFEQQTEEPIRRLRFTPDAVDPPPLELRRLPLEQQPEELPQRRELVPQPAAIVPGDQPPNRTRPRAEESERERPIQRLAVPLPSGAAPAGDPPPTRRAPQPIREHASEEPIRRLRTSPDAVDLPPLPPRKRPEERADTDVPQRRPGQPVDGSTAPDVPPLRGPRPLEYTQTEAPTRLRVVPPGSAVDPPPLRRWIRVEEPQADETCPRRFLVYVAPLPADAPPLPLRRVPVEFASEESRQRLRVTPPNAPIVPGDFPPLRIRQPSTEYQSEERPQRRALSVAISGNVIVFHPRFVVQAPTRRRTLKAPK